MLYISRTINRPHFNVAYCDRVERQQNKRNSVSSKAPTRLALELRILILLRVPLREGGITYVRVLHSSSVYGGGHVKARNSPKRADRKPPIPRIEYCVGSNMNDRRLSVPASRPPSTSISKTWGHRGFIKIQPHDFSIYAELLKLIWISKLLRFWNYYLLLLPYHQKSRPAINFLKHKMKIILNSARTNVLYPN